MFHTNIIIKTLSSLYLCKRTFPLLRVPVIPTRGVRYRGRSLRWDPQNFCVCACCRRHAFCAFFPSARWFHTKLIVGIPPFFCQTRLLFFCFAEENTRYSRERARKKLKRHGEESERGVRRLWTAGQESHCEVSEPSLILLCCVCSNFQAAAAAAAPLSCVLEVLGYLTYFAFSRCHFADSDTRVFNRVFLF